MSGNKYTKLSRDEYISFLKTHLLKSTDINLDEYSVDFDLNFSQSLGKCFINFKEDSFKHFKIKEECSIYTSKNPAYQFSIIFKTELNAYLISVINDILYSKNDYINDNNMIIEVYDSDSVKNSNKIGIFSSNIEFRFKSENINLYIKKNTTTNTAAFNEFIKDVVFPKLKKYNYTSYLIPYIVKKKLIEENQKSINKITISFRTIFVIKPKTDEANDDDSNEDFEESDNDESLLQLLLESNMVDLSKLKIQKKHMELLKYIKDDGVLKKNADLIGDDLYIKIKDKQKKNWDSNSYSVEDLITKV